jgi:tetratricopeptide (TPR) repeat protein
MKRLFLIIILLISFVVCAQDDKIAIDEASKNADFATALTLFSQGKYESTSDELKSIQAKLEGQNLLDKKKQALIFYWLGICFNRVQDYAQAIEHFKQALKQEYAPLDIHYEYGQALFASDLLSLARIQFQESLHLKFKSAVSLYYIAFISQQLGETELAISYYEAIEQLAPNESKEVRQAAELQIGDIYLGLVEKHPDVFREVDNYVIPQYKRALKVDADSNLAPQIQEKITNLQRKYELVLFKLRNGRPTSVPPYFARLALEYGHDTNVTFSPDEQKVAQSKKASDFAKTDVIGRYTFYYKDFLSFAPEARVNYTRYLNRVPEIYRNDNALLAPALRTAYEYQLWNKPSAFLFDYDYGDAKRDVNQKEQLDYSYRSHTFMMGQKFNYFDWGETILRIRRRVFDSYINSSDSQTLSFVLEQTRNFQSNTLLIYASYDCARVKNTAYNTNAFTLRTDLIMSRFRDWFTPSFGLGLTRTDPFNDSARGTEYLVNPNVRLTKTFVKNLRGNLKFDYQNYQSDDTAHFAYKKYLYSFELEYVF